MMSAMQICQGVFVIVCCMILGWRLLFFCVTRFLEFLFSNHHLLFLKFVRLVMVSLYIQMDFWVMCPISGLLGATAYESSA